MARHHYIPQSVLRNFVCADAWTLVADERSRERTCQADSAAIEAAGVRTNSLPLAVLRKGAAGQTGRIERSTVWKTCSAAGFYGLKTYPDDTLLRGLLRQTIDSFAGVGPGPTTAAELRALGTEAIDPDAVERTFLQGMDAAFATACHKGRCGDRLDDLDLRALRRSLRFARTRTPAGRNGRFSEVMLARMADVRQRLKAQITPHQFHRPQGISVERMLELYEENKWALAAILAAADTTDTLSRHGARVAVLVAPVGTPFVTCDNPARPFDPDAVSEISTAGDPGFGRPGSIGVYPIGPSHCLIVTLDQSVPDGASATIGAAQVRRINTALLRAARDEVVLPRPGVDGLFEEGIDPLRIGPPRRP